MVLISFNNQPVDLTNQWAPQNDPSVRAAAAQSKLDGALEKIVALEAKNSQLEEVAYVDSLTRVFNLGGFKQQSENILSILRRLDNTEDDLIRNGSDTDNEDILKRKTDGGAYVLIDLDGFKEINDTLGHDAGDEVLKKIAVLLEGATRAHDIVGRIGGDEFAILVRIQDDADLQAFAKNLQTKLDDNIVEIDGKEIKATASVGYCPVDLNSGNDPIGDAKKQADKNMYANKKARYPDRAPR